MNRSGMRWAGWLRSVLERVGRRGGGDATSPGVRGERVAERWLHKHRYRVIDRNLRVGDDEADLIARDPDGRTIVIVEVKTRTDRDSLPEERVDHRKQFRLARLAANLQTRKRYRGRPFRFDVIAVNLPPDDEPLVRHIPGAFDSPF